MKRTDLALACVLTFAAGGVAAAESDAQHAAPSKNKANVITNSVGMKLAAIPAGAFVMGSPSGEKERRTEEVQHEVTITKPFYMGVFEVSQREFERVMGKPRSGAVFNAERGGSPNHPMESVEWQKAVDFCEKLSMQPEEKRNGRTYRLPTEAEWEYACRGGSKTVFHVGDALSSKQANFNGKYPYGGAEKGPYLRKTVKVGSYAPNAFGLYDMHGNVAEWCSDWYDANYYAKSPKQDPSGPPKGSLSTDYGHFFRVIRGGCWLDDARACRAAYRYRAMPENRHRLVGFRVVCEVKVRKADK